MRPPLPLLVALVMFAPAPAAWALPFNDPETGLRFDPPAPFVSMPLRSDSYEIALGIASTTGEPVMGPGDRYLCELLYTPVAAYAGMSQQELNNLANDPAWAAQAAQAVAQHYAVTSQAAFVLDGAIGAEIVAEPKPGSGGGASVFVSILDTPGGRTTLNCATRTEAMPAALEKFRLIRSAITPPTRQRE